MAREVNVSKGIYDERTGMTPPAFGGSAVIAWMDKDGSFDEEGAVGVRLYRYGDPERVEAFLAWCYLAGHLPPPRDPRGIACFAAAVANVCDFEVAVDRLDRLNAGSTDNGLYVCDGWRVAERRGAGRMEAFLREINDAQPESARVFDDDIDEFMKGNPVIPGARPIL